MRIRIALLPLAMLALISLAACKQQTVVVQQPVAPSPMEYFNAGLNFYNNGQYVPAAEQFEMAAAQMPSMVDAHYYRGMCYVQLNQILRAEEAFQAALRYNPNHLLTREALGILYYNRGNTMAAKAELETARALNSVSPTVYYCLGKLYMMERNCKEAILAFEKALRLNPAYGEAQVELSQAKAKCGAPKKPAQPPVRQEKTFKGGAKALDPSDF
ncbi:MAG: tetratricopeptide repeat protein [Desulfovibrio sp.]|nr:tetratricopeptide repeat protein [Desulfovibrio sp.]